MADAPPGVMRPSGAHGTLEAPKRRERYFVVGGLVVAVALVLTFHFVGGKTATATATREAPAAPATPSAFAPVTDPTAAAPTAAAPTAAAPTAAAPTAVAPVAVVAAAQAEPAAVPATAAPSATPEPAAAGAATAQAHAVAAVAVAPAAVAPAAPAPAALARPTMAAVAPAAGADAYDAALGECRAHVAAGRISRAMTTCKAAIDARPQAPEALTLLAEAEFTRGHTGVALRLATAAAEANQNFADAYVIIGGAYQETGKNAEARAAYEQYLALQPRGKHAADLRSILAGLP